MNKSASDVNVNGSVLVRLRTVIQGAVQGVGFRPFVYRLAAEMRLVGWVSNTPQGVFIEVEGVKSQLDQFLVRLRQEKPKISFIQSMESTFLDAKGFRSFEIRESNEAGLKTTLVLPDIATCPDCLKEIFDPNDRRHLYPFTNCTNCGPRFSIIESLPYDRANTSMKAFKMCAECQNEYENPANRRFHAQPNACPLCGPRLTLWDAKKQILSENLYALLGAAQALREGRVVAIKGLGGFHLMVDARNDEAVARLRQRKHREEKPFAVMYPSLERLLKDCDVSNLEERLLLSCESPIVLLRKLETARDLKRNISLVSLSGLVAPQNPYLGVMLPYTPLHHILLNELRFPVVATSGNLSDEPICTDEHEAIARLNGIADLFLVHNRPIVRHVDDSIVRILLGRELVLRRARGYAPLPVHIQRGLETPLIGVGAHLKNTVAVSQGSNVFISQHIGDLETQESYQAFQATIRDFQKLYDISDPRIVCDLHPDYMSSKYAHGVSSEVMEVQHHYAHIMACMAENQVESPTLGVSWDGTGFGLDGSVWGGEFLVTNEASFERVATFQQFRLPGGDKAVKEPRRCAIGALYEIAGDALFSLGDVTPLKTFSETELDVLHQMLRKGVNSPRTSSVGRLFDAVASIVGLRQVVRFEGQAAMELEFLTKGIHTDECYPFELQHSSSSSGITIVDWRPIVLAIMEDLRRNADLAVISTRMHNSLVKVVVQVAQRVGLERIVLSGGCFQNAYLTEQCVTNLRKAGFHPYWHQRVPPNDGGISLGQVFAISRQQLTGSKDRHISIAEEVTR